MSSIKPQILAVDDEESVLSTYQNILKKSYNLFSANNAKEALDILQKEPVSLVLLDLIMPGLNGIETLSKIKQIDKNIEVIVVTAVRDIKTAVRSIKLGAYDYLPKPFEAEELFSVIEKALERRALIRENVCLRQEIEEKCYYLDLIGKSKAMRSVFSLIDKVSAADSTVLITGESGTGKELAAHAVHKKSRRENKPFVALNCAAVPENLCESELFGHEAGAFTGALERREGKFELADGGTIFLDEIGCLSLSLQSKLLRVLQDQSIERLGGKKPIQVNVRIVAATNLEMEEAIKKKQFREDLYYRLNVLRIHMPPLCERKEDIPLLISYFLEKYNKEINKKVKGFTEEVLELLRQYDWPGNVRELSNFVERAVALSEEKEYLSFEDVSLENVLRRRTAKTLKEAQVNLEKTRIENALCEAQGNQTRASEILGINRTTLITKMKLLGLK